MVLLQEKGRKKIIIVKIKMYLLLLQDHHCNLSVQCITKGNGGTEGEEKARED